MDSGSCVMDVLFLTFAPPGCLFPITNLTPFPPPQKEGSYEIVARGFPVYYLPARPGTDPFFELLFFFTGTHVELSRLCKRQWSFFPPPLLCFFFLPVVRCFVN